jgi:methylamine dehydrogenase accessory protein MauD
MDIILIPSVILLWVIVLFNLLLTFALVRRLNNIRPNDAKSQISRTDLGLATGEFAPDFTAPTLSGETVTRSTYAGRKVAFVFISAHCTPCHELLLQIESLTHSAVQAGVQVVLVSSNKQKETRTFFEQKKISFPVLVVPSEANTFLTDYRYPGTPAYCFVNADGKVHAVGIVSIMGTVWKELDAWIKQEVVVA